MTDAHEVTLPDSGIPKVKPWQSPRLFEMRDDYRAKVNIDHSSAAKGPCLWLRIEGGDITDNEAASHLTLAQARLLRTGLDAAIEEAERDWS